jgi:hypothetical protein
MCSLLSILLSVSGLALQAGPTLQLSKVNLNFQSIGSSAAPQSISVTNAGSGSMSWSAVSDQAWLTLSPASGIAPGSIQVAIKADGLAAGSYKGRVTVTAPGALSSPATISVSLLVPSPTLVLASKVLKITTGADGKGSGALMISNSGGGILKWTADASSTWIRLPVTSGSGAYTLPVLVDMTGYKAGTYLGAMTIHAPGANGAPAYISVTAVVGASVPATPVTVSINSAPASVASGSTTQMSATVSGSSNQQVAWTTTAGSVSSAGLFTAPAVTANTNVTITARSVADTTAYATAQITVVPPSSQSQSAVFSELNGLVVMEAEHGVIVNRTASWALRNSQTGFSGSGYMAAEADLGVNLAADYVGVAPELRFRVNFSQAGNYYVWIRGLAPNAAGDSLHVGLDGQRVPTAECVSELPLDSPVWGWSSWVMDKTARAYIQVPTAGEHTVNVWMREDGILLDRLLLTTSSSVTPADLGPAESAYAGILPNGVPASTTPTLSVSQTSLTFTATAGQSSPAAQTVNVSTGAVAANWTASTAQSWLSISPKSGSGTGSLQIQAVTGSLSQGTYSGSVAVTSTGTAGSPQTINVKLTVQAAAAVTPTLSVTPTQLSFSAVNGGSAPSAQRISISNSSGSPLGWTATASQSWISLSALSGSMPADLTVQTVVTGLSVGTHQGTVTVSSPGVTGSPVTVAVVLTISDSQQLPGSGNQFYVAPNGKSTGNGSISSPWDLATALAHPAAVKPGDTIWLRGGTYVGNFTSKLKGAVGKPIIVRQYPGERATIDTSTITTGAGITANGSDTWFWGFEIMSSYTQRRTGAAGSFSAPSRVDGIDTYGPRNKFINLVVHDTAQGFGYWTPAEDNEIYGSLIYYNGWSGPDRGHGHGVYGQNLNGTKVIEDNIQFAGFGMGLRCYGSENAYAKHFRFLGNVSFNSGYLAGGPTNHWSNYMVTVGSGAEDIVFDDNHSYHTTTEDGYSQLGWSFSGVEKDLKARNNYFIGGESAVEVWNWNQLTFTGNVMYARGNTDFVINFNHLSNQNKAAYAFDDNTYYGSGLFRYQKSNTAWSNWKNLTGLDKDSKFISGRPTGVWTYVRPNRYESGRANLIVYNWDGLQSVKFDVSAVLRAGQNYEVRDAMNFYGTAVASGVYSGAAISVPMTGLTIAPPVGNVNFQPKHTAPEFGVFVLLGK